MNSKADRELIEKAKKLTEKQRLMDQVLSKKRPVGTLDLEALKNEIERDFGVPIDRTLIRETADEIERLRGGRPDRMKMEETIDAIGSAVARGAIVPAQGAKSSPAVSPTVPLVARTDDEVRSVFEEMKSELREAVFGQGKACDDVLDALRRPYLERRPADLLRHTLYLYGPNGSGRHFLLEKSAELMAKYGFWRNSKIALLDMRHYPSSSQEAVFLQDLYVCLKGEAPIILIENFEESNAIYNKMLGQLMTEGRLQLAKRYMVKGESLQESTHLHQSDLIGELRGNGKHFVLISTKKPSLLLDLYGKSVYDAIGDKVGMAVLDRESLERIIRIKLDAMRITVLEKLGVTLDVDEPVFEALLALFEPEDGVDSISPTIVKLYDAIVDLVLKHPKFESMRLIYDKGYRVVIGEESILLHTEDDSQSEIAAIKKELEEIVGLEEVKRYMLSLEDVVRMQRIRKQSGMRVDEISKHMIFTGNPGTGKTTIARLVSRLMKAIGVLEQGQLVEVTRADLVGRYVGHTAPLTMSVIRSALGGVLFIDEAYSLYRGKDDSFGLEAIDTLVKAMEDHRDDLIVILAGYSREMAEFLESNSGLRSRFPNRIFFRDYTAEELVRIAQSIAKRKEYRIDGAVLEPLRLYFERKQQNAAENGNGRLARNVVEAAIIKQSNRLVAVSADGGDPQKLDELILDDFDLDR